MSTSISSGTSAVREVQCSLDVCSQIVDVFEPHRHPDGPRTDPGGRELFGHAGRLDGAADDEPEVDLGGDVPLDSVRIWNRSERHLYEDLDGFRRTLDAVVLGERRDAPGQRALTGNFIEVTPDGQIVWRYANSVVREGILAADGEPGTGNATLNWIRLPFQALFIVAVSYQMGAIAVLDIKGRFLVMMTAAQGLGAAIGLGTFIVGRGIGGGAISTKASNSSWTPKLLMADPKNTGVWSPARHAAGSNPWLAP